MLIVERKRWYGLILVLLLVSTSACTASRAASEEIKPAAFAQALDNEVAYLHLHNGRRLKAESVYVNPDSVHYARERGASAFRAVPTRDVAFINITRPRRPSKINENVMGGLGVGVAIGVGLCTGAYFSLRNVECRENCIGPALVAGWACLSIPVLGLTGLVVGSLVNIPRPSDTYYIQVEDGRVSFVVR